MAFRIAGYTFSRRIDRGRGTTCEENAAFVPVEFFSCSRVVRSTVLLVHLLASSQNSTIIRPGDLRDYPGGRIAANVSDLHPQRAAKRVAPCFGDAWFRWKRQTDENCIWIRIRASC